MSKYKILQKRERCIGCGACVSICPNNWFMDKDRKSKPKKTEVDERELQCNKNAANACPVGIIKIEKVK
ncbi:hypothetical protein AUJ10_03520 [Candidatus Pacearchaeota archaeon CG1_02_31_27]|nr:MAG: hypothetical protein AUJ10_03520 [Candidatus Pacearchaeota archaeon CG1_02_31_27]PIN92127.1 MAG: ferredoxin [Candidatus Pacearchaeota archaeon CG10_big_fil_rev_8_21_14_0_10_31_59]PIZ80505.1 MAG: ferredoxin [Candidatus Pacearchaeota archaeon CG_4_10_14_0_2_um_filter_31_10]